jgi:hypothetical protein
MAMPPAPDRGLPEYGRPPGSPTPLTYPPEHMPPEYAPRARARRWPWITCGIIIGVLLIPCALLAILGVYLFSGIAGTNGTISTFCDDLKAQRYSAAYDTFSTQLQSQVSREQFVAVNTQRDQTDGPVRACGNPQISISLHNNNAYIPLAITRTQTYTGTIHLVHEGNGWKIDAIDPALQLTP